MSDLPLDDVRVIDLTTGLAGPLCTKILAELGADVVKVEPIEGDEARRYGPFGPAGGDLDASALFVYFNLNKRGVTLNLKTEAGKKVLHELARGADILVESFPPGYLDNLGVGYLALSRVNSKLVMTSISSFGGSGSYRDYQATDLVLYALGGMMYISGDYDRHPLMHVYDQAQRAGGMNGAVATLGALYHQRETGAGQYVDVSIFESVVSEVQQPVGRYAYTGGIETRGPKERPLIHKRFIRVKNGYIGLNTSGRNTWEKFAEFLGIPELLEERFSNPKARTLHTEELNTLLTNALKDRDKEELWHSALANSFTFQIVQRPEEAMVSAQLEARRFFVEVEHPRFGRLKLPGDTYGFSETPWHVRRRSPLLGEHNAEVYCGELDYTEDELSRLRYSGAI